MDEADWDSGVWWCEVLFCRLVTFRDISSRRLRSNGTSAISVVHACFNDSSIPSDTDSLEVGVDPAVQPVRHASGARSRELGHSIASQLGSPISFVVKLDPKNMRILLPDDKMCKT